MTIQLIHWAVERGEIEVNKWGMREKDNHDINKTRENRWNGKRGEKKEKWWNEMI